MKVTLFTNATILDATKDMLAQIDKSDFSQEHIVVVPDKFSLQAEEDVLSLLGDSLFNVSVMGLTKLANKILEDMGVRQESITNAEGLLLTQKAIDEVADRFKVLKRVDGLALEMNKLISQLKSSCIEGGDFNLDCEGLSAGKYHDILLVFEKYNEFLGGRLDQNGKLLLASRFAGDRLKNKHFYFAYFDAFTSEGYKLLDSLICNSTQMSFACPQALSIGNEYLYDNDIRDKVTRLAIKNGASVEVKSGEHGFSPIKNALLRGVMSYEKVRLDNKGFYTLLGASGIEEEVEFVAKTIFYLIHNGYRYRDIGVYVGDINKYKGCIDRIFSSFDLVYFLDTTLLAKDTMICRGVISLLAVCGGGYQKNDLISLFLNPLFESEDLGGVVLENDVWGRGRYKKYLSSFKYDWFFDEYHLCKSVKDYVELIRRFLRESKGAFDEFWRKDEAYVREEGINIQAWSVLEESLDLLEKYDSIIKGEEFSSRLKGLLSMTDLSALPSYIDSVMVGGTDSSMRERKILFILGGQDLPITLAEGGLLSDDQLKLSPDKEISPSVRMINKRNRFKLFTLLSTSTERLIVTYQSVNDEGKRIELPSYIASLNSIFSQKEVKLSLYLEGIMLTKEGGLLNAGNRSCFIREGGILGVEKYNHIERDWVENGGIFFEDSKFSASQIESYFSCPFKHFVRYGLRLKDRKQSDFSPIDVGNICHKMAEIFLLEWKKNKSVFVENFVDKTFKWVIQSLDLSGKLYESEDGLQREGYLKNYLKGFLRDVKRELSHTKLTPLPPEKYISNIEVEGLSLKGRADSVNVGGGYFTIIDYKTGKTGDILKELYFGGKLQLFLYSNAVARESGLTSGGVFYFNGKFAYSTSDEDKKILKGIVRNDEGIIPLLDSDIEEIGRSDILSIEKGDNCYKGRAIAGDDFSKYEAYSLKVAGRGLAEMKEGYIQAKPLSGACERCSYRGICLQSKDKGFRQTNGKIEF